MEELFRLCEDVDEKYASIPQYCLSGDIACMEFDAYNIALDNFVNYGRMFFHDPNMSYGSLRNAIYSMAIMQTRELLKERGENAIAAFLSSPSVVQSTLSSLELALHDKETLGNDFYSNTLYDQEKKLLSNFNPEELASFKTIQEYICKFTGGGRK